MAHKVREKKNVKRKIKLRNTKQTLQLIGMLWVGMALLACLTMLRSKVTIEEEQTLEANTHKADTKETVEAFYTPFNVEQEPEINVVGDLFVLQFPLEEDWMGNPFAMGFVPNEDLGKELVQEHGYKFFLEGLMNDNPYVQWYSAYRLVEFYNSGSKEEIMMALAQVEQNTSYKEVENACRFTMNILSQTPEQEEKISCSDEGEMIFTRFFETNLGGGQKVYIIKGEKLSELFVWKDQEYLAGVKEVKIAKDGSYAWIYLQKGNQLYNYVIDLQETKYPYYATRNTLLSNDGEQGNELLELSRSLMDKVSEQEPFLLDGVQVEGNWTEDNTLQIACGEERYTYLPDTKELKIGYKAEWDEYYDYTRFVKELEDKGIPFQQKAHYYSSVFSTIREELSIGKESVLIYEYNTSEEMQSISNSINPLGTKLGNKTISNKQNTHLYKKGRLIVLYYGANKEIMDTLKGQLGEQFAGTATS